jgi:hypothetical protein
MTYVTIVTAIKSTTAHISRLIRYRTTTAPPQLRSRDFTRDE